MCLSESYILRLSNVSHATNTNLVSLSTDKSEFTVQIPNYLRSKGKCQIKVVDIHIQIKNGTGNSIVPANAHTALIQIEGIPFLGYSNENGGYLNSLGEMTIDSNKNDIKLDGVGFNTFICPDLPPQITLKKMVYNPSTPFLPIPMDNYTTDVVPCIITLQLSFFEDEKK
tara:strand:- start:183 stop:692 length:510 start_codon:yes stop_codon:yes gene_type:complete